MRQDCGLLRKLSHTLLIALLLGPKSVAQLLKLNTGMWPLVETPATSRSMAALCEMKLNLQLAKYQHLDDPAVWPLSYVTASSSRHNPVERIAILIFGSDLGARFDSKLQHGAVLGPNTALLWADSRPEICS